ncbi:hypothetical protein [Streptomyces sp. bgisy060]|uniref:hypothetical protein n=1 Tax=Streptomyces sp. bgisy060 TaxID=3413775 RepID=UPI003EBD483F
MADVLARIGIGLEAEAVVLDDIRHQVLEILPGRVSLPFGRHGFSEVLLPQRSVWTWGKAVGIERFRPAGIRLLSGPF